MSEQPVDQARVDRLRSGLKAVLVVTGILQLIATICISAYPLVTIGLALPIVILLIVIVRVDGEIIRSGGRSFWRDGRFHRD